jgi:hypothetical protein
MRKPAGNVTTTIDPEDDVTVDIRPIESAPMALKPPPGSGTPDDWRDTPYDTAAKEQIDALFERFGAMVVKTLARTRRMTLGQIVDALGK